MTLTSSPSRRRAPSSYGCVSRFNHWLTATLFIGALGLGLVMAYGGLPRESVGALMGWHKALGVATIAYGLWRVGWRIAKGFPPPASETHAWQIAASKAVHVGLLAAILAMPLSGILMTVSAGRALSIWGVTLLPSLGEIGWLETAAEAVHTQLPFAVLAMLALHIGAALKHHFIDHDATLARMTSGRIRA
ncbi:cytochrome b [Chachezhania antarctica]|uniref:cytochrome b n=1 Tax=Chachezhania antarctica TaxID=2340860 RepID=UPI000EB44D9C|nr:cytochrome b [Chachezhania antarctica]